MANKVANEDRDGRDEFNEVPRQEYRDYFRHFDLVFQQVSNEVDGVAATRILQPEEGKRAMLFQKALIEVTLGRRFCILSTGFIGLMPQG